MFPVLELDDIVLVPKVIDNVVDAPIVKNGLVWSLLPE
jgi:hypothetical protein